MSLVCLLRSMSQNYKMDQRNHLHHQLRSHLNCLRPVQKDLNEVHMAINCSAPKTSSVSLSISCLTSSFLIKNSSHFPFTLLIPVTTNDLANCFLFHLIALQAVWIQSMMFCLGATGIFSFPLPSSFSACTAAGILISSLFRQTSNGCMMGVHPPGMTQVQVYPGISSYSTLKCGHWSYPMWVVTPYT